MSLDALVAIVLGALAYLSGVRLYLYGRLNKAGSRLSVRLWLLALIPADATLLGAAFFLLYPVIGPDKWDVYSGPPDRFSWMATALFLMFASLILLVAYHACTWTITIVAAIKYFSNCRSDLSNQEWDGHEV